jgi:hypothetical protein
MVDAISVKRTVVATTFPYPLKWDRGDLDVRIEDKVFEVHFEREYRRDSDPAVSGSGILASSNLELERDRLGRAAHTRVEIRFPMYVEHETDNPWPLLDWVHAVINRVLDVYRYATDEFHVETIPKNELRDYTVRTVGPDGTFSSPTMIIPHWKVYLPPEPISDEARRLLGDGTDLPIQRVLYLNAKREVFYENYRLAVVEAETAFEVLIDQVIAQYYRGQGLSSAEIENKLRAGLTNLIEHHIPRCCGEAFEGTPEHTAWQNDLYNLRNSVVHDGASVDGNQARDALDAAEQAINWIQARASV